MLSKLPDRIAITGASGQLGGEFQELLPSAVALNRDAADLTQPLELRNTLMELRPQLVLNCAAFNAVDRAEEEPEVAFAVNATGVRDLARTCRDLGAMLIHFSSDAVFGLEPTRIAPYSELALPGPVNVYGASKLAGEYFVRTICPQHLVIRTCGLYGHRGRHATDANFVDRIIARVRDGEELRVVNDQKCTPSSAAEMATATLHAVRSGLRGLLHLTNGGSCSWFEFARTAISMAGLNTSVIPITTSEWAAAAPRPGYSVLDNNRYQAAKLPPIPNWKESLERYVRSPQRAAVSIGSTT